MDHYQTLQVIREADAEVIERAYKALSMKHHPDRARARASRGVDATDAAHQRGVPRAEGPREPVADTMPRCRHRARTAGTSSGTVDSWGCSPIGSRREGGSGAARYRRAPQAICRGRGWRTARWVAPSGRSLAADTTPDSSSSGCRRTRCLGLSGLAIREFVADCTHDGRVANGTVIQRHAINDRDGVEQPAILDFGDDRVVLGAHARIIDVVVVDASVVTKAAAQLGRDDCGDLLRRPRGTSTAGEAVCGAGNVEDLDDDRLGHGSSPFYLNWMAPMGHTRMHAPHPVHFSSTTLYALPLGTIAPSGQARRAGQYGLLSHRASEMVTSGMGLGPSCRRVLGTTRKRAWCHNTLWGICSSTPEADTLTVTM